MNKNDLIAKVADLTDLSKADANRAVDGVFDTIDVKGERRIPHGAD